MQFSKLKGIPVPNVINLLECEDRRDYTLRNFAKLGCAEVTVHNYERFENSDYEIKGDPGAISKTSKGCFSSHVLTIKKWLENTDEPIGIFFEDDVDFSTVAHWNFTFEEFIDTIGDDWEAIQLCGIYESTPLMMPRARLFWDHGIQCYVLKRNYAQKLVDYYFKGDNEVMTYSMPNDAPPSVENNILNSFGTTLTFPLFNHNINDFKSENINPCVENFNQQTTPSIHSYKFIKEWWEIKGSRLSLEQICKGEGA